MFDVRKGSLIEDRKGMHTFEMMLFASSGSDVTLPAPAVCRDVFNTRIELEQVSGKIERRKTQEGGSGVED